jgi:GH35 family endo-1,4-beta-xylanase
MYSFSYIQQIRDLINNGAPVNGIGCQAHMGPNSIDLNKVEDSLNRFWSEFHIPIWITEFDFQVRLF